MDACTNCEAQSSSITAVILLQLFPLWTTRCRQRWPVGPSSRCVMRDPAQANPGWGTAARSQQPAESSQRIVDCTRAEKMSTVTRAKAAAWAAAWPRTRIHIPPPIVFYLGLDLRSRQSREPTLLTPLVQGMQTPAIPFGGQRRRPFGAFTNGFLEKCGSPPVRQPTPAQDAFGGFSRKSDGSVFLGRAWKHGGHPMSMSTLPADDPGLDGRGAEGLRVGDGGRSCRSLRPLSTLAGLGQMASPSPFCSVWPFTSHTFPSPSPQCFSHSLLTSGLLPGLHRFSLDLLDMRRNENCF